jgi:PAS domain S-box-containing protein
VTEKPTYDELLARVKALEESKDRYRSLAENTSDLLYRTDQQGKIVFLSKSVYELSGYTMEEAIGMNMAEDVYLVPEEREQFLSALRKEGKVTNFSARLKRKDGSVWWASTNAHFFLDENGEVGGVEGIARDITELRTAQEAQKNLIEELKGAMAKIRTLSGMLPICSSCKKIRDDKGYWTRLEAYIYEHTDAQLSHGLCPDCAKKLYPYYADGAEKDTRPNTTPTEEKEQ